MIGFRMLRYNLEKSKTYTGVDQVCCFHRCGCIQYRGLNHFLVLEELILGLSA